MHLVKKHPLFEIWTNFFKMDNTGTGPGQTMQKQNGSSSFASKAFCSKAKTMRHNEACISCRFRTDETTWNPSKPFKALVQFDQPACLRETAERERVWSTQRIQSLKFPGLLLELSRFGSKALPASRSHTPRAPLQQLLCPSWRFCEVP